MAIKVGGILSLRFILGRAGMGKTSYITSKITENLISDPTGSPIILIVPEQSTFQMEQKILQNEEIQGFTRLHILSFDRMSKKVLEMKGGSCKTYLSDLGKEMILRRIVQERLNEGDLKVLEKAAKQRGFVDKLSGFIREAKMYNIFPEELSSLDKIKTGVYEKGHDTLDKKIEEISLIYDDYENFIHDNYLHQEDYYLKAYEKMAQFSLLSKSQVYVDDFFGFTPREIMLLEKILLTASEVEISLTMDPLLLRPEYASKINQVDLFYPVLETYNKINHLARKNNVEILEPEVLPHGNEHRFGGSKELRLLEKNWDKVYPVEIYADKCEKVELIQASNRRGEVEKIARKILTDIRENKLRFKEISIILRDFEDYEPLIKSVFSNYEIPYFIDKKEDIHYHPLVELLRAVLEIILSNWSYESVFRFLKTDLVGLDRDQMDKLENYVLAHGIKGGDWLMDRPWNYLLQTDLDNLEDEISKSQESYLNEINKTRDKVVEILKPTFDLLKSGKYRETFTVKEISLELWNLLDRMEIPSKLKDLILESKVQNKHYEMQFNTQVWANIVQMFEELIEFLGDKDMNLRDYLHVLEEGFQNISMGLLPPSLDQVVIGSIERSRQHNIKSLYIMGMCEGAFPASFLESGLFNDKERLLLRDQKIELAPTTEKKLFDEQFWAYIAFTRAKNKMVLSYPLSAQDGSSLHPSSLLNGIKRILPTLEEEYFHEDILAADLDFLTSPNKLAPVVTCKLINSTKEAGEIPPFWQEVLNVLQTDYPDEFKKNKVFQGLEYKNEVKSLLGNYVDDKSDGKLKSSVSAMENYSACPFMYYASRVLKLQEREYYRLDPLGFGILYHAALKHFFERLKQEEISWKDVTETQIETYLDQILSILSERLKNKILEDSSRNKYIREKLKEHLVNAISILAEHEIEGGFSPAYAELGFGSRGDLPPYKIELSEGRTLEIEGKIDRVDEGELEGRKYIRVIDYKGRARPLDLLELYNGINLQLSVYLLVIIENSNFLWNIDTIYPAGMLYFGIRSPLVTTTGPLSLQEARKMLRNTMKMEGYILEDEEVFNSMTGGREDLLKQKYSKNKGRFTSNSRVLDIEEFDTLLKYTEEKIREVGNEICQGEFDILPYKAGTSTPCGFCPYHPVCQFDPRFSANNYRRIGTEADYLRLMSKKLTY